MNTTSDLVIAYRSASSYAPENTYAAFDVALEIGARHLELNVQMTSDDRLVTIQDDWVNRTTNGFGRVWKHTLAELQVLNAGAWFDKNFAGQHIPTLEAVLDHYRGRAHPHVEIKGKTEGLSERTAHIIRTLGWAGKVTMTSF
jgi:glycerophosphoryl diester phosphodiesterase